MVTRNIICTFTKTFSSRSKHPINTLIGVPYDRSTLKQSRFSSVLCTKIQNNSTQKYDVLHVNKSKVIPSLLSDQASEIVWQLYTAPNIGRHIFECVAFIWYENARLLSLPASNDFVIKTKLYICFDTLIQFLFL